MNLFRHNNQKLKWQIANWVSDSWGTIILVMHLNRVLTFQATEGELFEGVQLCNSLSTEMTAKTEYMFKCEKKNTDEKQNNCAKVLLCLIFRRFGSLPHTPASESRTFLSSSSVHCFFKKSDRLLFSIPKTVQVIWGVRYNDGIVRFIITERLIPSSVGGRLVDEILWRPSLKIILLSRPSLNIEILRIPLLQKKTLCTVVVPIHS